MATMEVPGGLGAIVLASASATGVDGAAPPLVEPADRAPLAAAVGAATAAGARPVTVVGPVLDATLPVDRVRGEPAQAGSAAAIVAALESWRSPAALHSSPLSAARDPAWTLLLACDLPGAGAIVARLLSDLVLLPSDSDGMCLADASSRPRWLIGVYRTAALRAAASALPDGGRSASVQALMDDLAITVVVADGLTRGVDTEGVVEEAHARGDVRRNDAP